MGNEIPEMRYHLGGGPVGPPWTNGTIQAGAWREDEEDVVYGYYQYAPGDPEGALISITHFWDADGGLNQTSDLNDYALGIYWSYSCENAMQKMLKYYNGDY
ncbi:MAG: hypothetical protein HXY50_03290, partial [Ignavibacteriaceae bacterium]|nr:hypothetical protein [Ignavibacteriaceae bacterium]